MKKFALMEPSVADPVGLIVAADITDPSAIKQFASFSEAEKTREYDPPDYL